MMRDFFTLKPFLKIHQKQMTGFIGLPNKIERTKPAFVISFPEKKYLSMQVLYPFI